MSRVYVPVIDGIIEDVEMPIIRSGKLIIEDVEDGLVSPGPEIPGVAVGCTLPGCPTTSTS